MGVGGVNHEMPCGCARTSASWMPMRSDGTTFLNADGDRIQLANVASVWPLLLLPPPPPPLVLLPALPAAAAPLPTQPGSIGDSGHGCTDREHVQHNNLPL